MEVVEVVLITQNMRIPCGQKSTLSIVVMLTGRACHGTKLTLMPRIHQDKLGEQFSFLILKE
ncbi:hypothetical protein MITS9509_02456 [Synechococcus sp. MIT S9509]|nr:hypothetical protein MITS9509_02456 [Synechococcus sp. MIT S9509]